MRVELLGAYVSSFAQKAGGSGGYETTAKQSAMSQYGLEL
jgi:hypothetical protein